MSADGMEAADAVRELGNARGLHWTAEESHAIAEQLRGTWEGLQAAASRLDTSGAEPATGFSLAWGGPR